MDLVNPEVGVVVLGPAAAGLCAAVVAAVGDAKVLIAEKESAFGESTAISGGVVWIPYNPMMENFGFTDSKEAAKAHRSIQGGVTACRHRRSGGQHSRNHRLRVRCHSIASGGCNCNRHAGRSREAPQTPTVSGAFHGSRGRNHGHRCSEKTALLTNNDRILAAGPGSTDAIVLSKLHINGASRIVRETAIQLHCAVRMRHSQNLETVNTSASWRGANI